MENPLESTLFPDVDNLQFNAFLKLLLVMRDKFRAQVIHADFCDWDEEERRVWLNHTRMTAALLVWESNELLERLPIAGFEKMHLTQT